MRHARDLFFRASLTMVALSLPLVASAAEPAVKVPAPVRAQKAYVPMPRPVPAQEEPIPIPVKKPEVPKDATTKPIKKNAVAKELFGVQKTAAALKPRAVGWYSSGCLAGGVKLPDNGPAWQGIYLSRNRHWGHPKLIELVKRLAIEAQKYDGWPGLLVGDIAQPRGGPMLTEHVSHQVGLDADIWLHAMPARRMTWQEREDYPKETLLDSTKLSVNKEAFTDKHVALIKRAASYREVQRIFVNPAIKKALCEMAGTDRRWLAKVQPIGGHHYHFHIRMFCPNGGCRAQRPVSGDLGCGKPLDQRLKSVEANLKRMAKAKPKETAEDKNWVPPSQRRKLTMAQLPAVCRTVLTSAGIEMVAEDMPVPKQVKTTEKK